MTCREPTVEIKRVFVDNLFRLSGDELAKVIEKLNERCESALDKVCISRDRSIIHFLSIEQARLGRYHR